MDMKRAFCSRVSEEVSGDGKTVLGGVWRWRE